MNKVVAGSLSQLRVGVLSPDKGIPKIIKEIVGFKSFEWNGDLHVVNGGDIQKKITLVKVYVSDFFQENPVKSYIFLSLALSEDGYCRLSIDEFTEVLNKDEGEHIKAILKIRLGLNPERKLSKVVNSLSLDPRVRDMVSYSMGVTLSDIGTIPYVFSEGSSSEA